MVERQEATPALLHEHIRQMGDTLALLNRLMHQTPYEPGAAWVRRLPLDDAAAEQARKASKTPACRESFVCVYAAHVDSVMVEASRAAPPSPNAKGPGATNRYPSIDQALGVVHPALGDARAAQKQLQSEISRLDRKYRSLRRASSPEAAAAQADNRAAQAQLTERLTAMRAAAARPSSAADLADPEKAQIARDALVITSVGLRLAMEATALATVIVMEARELSQDPKKWAASPPEGAKLLSELPRDTRRVYRELQSSASALEQLVDRLAALEHIDPSDAPGYEYKGGLVDELVGFGWDSVHIDAEAGGNALFYHALADEEFRAEDDGTTYDYSGRTNRLEYDVEPIVLASAQLAMKFDWDNWAEAVGLDLGFATNRGFESGGKIEDSSLARDLGVKNSLSDVLDAALAVGGVTAKARVARFTQGTVRNVSVEDGSTLAEVPFQFDMKQIDVAYDLAPRHNPVLRSLIVGFRYFDYSLPRILYELQDQTGEDPPAYEYSRETPAQNMRTRYYMVALGGRVEKRVTPRLSPFLTLDGGVGYGPTEYYFPIDEEEANDESNRQYTSTKGVGVGVAGAIGFRWKLREPGASFNVYLDAFYRAQFIYALPDSKNEDDTIVYTAMTDVFHGPTAAFGLSF